MWREEDSLSTLTGSGAASNCADVLLLKELKIGGSSHDLSVLTRVRSLYKASKGPAEDGRWWPTFSGWERLAPGFSTGLSQVAFTPVPSSLSGISKSHWATKVLV